MGSSYIHPQWIEPYFDPTTPRNVTALMGKSAYLSCRVRNLGNKTVSMLFDIQADKFICRNETLDANLGLCGVG